MEKTNNEKVNKALEIICDKAGVELSEITPESTWVDIGLDSLDLVEAVMVIEDACGFRVSEDDQANFTTVGDVIKYVEGK